MADRILLVMDEGPRLDAWTSRLRALHLEVRPAHDAAAANRLLADHPCVAVAVSAELSGQDTSGLLKGLKAQEGEALLPLLYLLPVPDPGRRGRAYEHGADEVLDDALPEEELRARVLRKLEWGSRMAALRKRVQDPSEALLKDGLTGCVTRRYLDERLVDEFRRAQRYDDRLALLLVRPSLVGDDAALRSASAALFRCVRQTDLLARLDPQRFALLLPKTHLAGAFSVAERVLEELGAEGDAAAHVGLASYPHPSVVSPESLLRASEDALRQAGAFPRRVGLYARNATY